MSGALLQKITDVLVGEHDTEQHFADLVLDSLRCYSGIHRWTSARHALEHYMGNRAEFYLDLGLWEARTGGPKVINWQCVDCGMTVSGEDHDCPVLGKSVTCPRDQRPLWLIESESQPARRRR